MYAETLKHIHRVSKKVGQFHFNDNFRKCGPINAFTVKFRNDLRLKLDLKTVTSPQMCCRTTLWNVISQPQSFTAQLMQLIQFKVKQRR